MDHPGSPAYLDRDRSHGGTRRPERDTHHAARRVLPGDSGSLSTMSEATVLVVDDEEYIRDLVTSSLRLAGFTARAVADGSQAIAAVAAEPPDLVVLDVRMPGIDGFEVCRRLRAADNDVPIVFLTARDSTEDRISGLTQGGDDYVTKPFSLEELVARIRAVLRRNRTNDPATSRLSYADLELDEDAMRVARSGEPIQLSPTEFKLLRYLLLNAERVVSKTQILDHVWQYDFNGDDNVVETYVSYLRRKIDRSDDKLIRTVRGFGYTLRAEAP
jgi:two-component system, OmpR family, response regulator